MARQAGTIIENQFTRGLITEATGLNYPEHAATAADNVKFLPKGQVVRRKGIDIEAYAETLSYSVSEGVVKEFVWQAVAQQGGYVFLVLQKGSNIHFFELETGDTISAGLTPISIDLENYRAAGGGAISRIPCSFSAGAGYLYIAHPVCDPVIVRYLSDTQEFEASKIEIRIRDFTGVEDDLEIEEQPDTLSDEHHYNLRNQGWDQQVRTGNVTNDIGPGGSLSPGTSRPRMVWSDGS